MARRKHQGIVKPMLRPSLLLSLIHAMLLFEIMLLSLIRILGLEQRLEQRLLQMHVLGQVLSLKQLPVLLLGLTMVLGLFLVLEQRLLLIQMQDQLLRLVLRKAWEKLKIKVPIARIKTSLITRILPEEYRADLNNLRHRWIVKQKLPKWLVNIRTCLFLLVVFKSWLQVKFENIFLPNNRSS